MPGAFVRPALFLHDATGHRIVRHVSGVNAVQPQLGPRSNRPQYTGRWYNAGQGTKVGRGARLCEA